MDIRYQIYPSLLNAYQDYVDAYDIWERYWGSSDDAPHTPDEFQAMRRQALIDRINRVPMVSDAADRGTAFNALVDRLIGGDPSRGVTIEAQDGEDGRKYAVTVKGKTYVWSERAARPFAERFDGCMPQTFVEGTIETRGGGVRLYGFTDYIGSTRVYDLKTTRSYERGQYATGWQHIVYPYCLAQMGADITHFEYTVAVGSNNERMALYAEEYIYHADDDTRRLRQRIEEFAAFIEDARREITDEKIFNYK